MRKVTDTIEKVIITCPKCKKEIKAFKESQANYLLRQHDMAKHTKR